MGVVKGYAIDTPKTSIFVQLLLVFHRYCLQFESMISARYMFISVLQTYNGLLSKQAMLVCMSVKIRSSPIYCTLYSSEEATLLSPANLCTHVLQSYGVVARTIITCSGLITSDFTIKSE